MLAFRPSGSICRFIYFFNFLPLLAGWQHHSFLGSLEVFSCTQDHETIEMKWNEINHLSSNWSFKQSTIFQTVIIERRYETHTQDALLLSLLSINLHIFMHQLRERLSVVKEMWGCRSWLNAHSPKVRAPMLSEARRVLTPSLKRKSLFFFASFYGPHPWQEDFLSTSWEVSTYFAR